MRKVEFETQGGAALSLYFTSFRSPSYNKDYTVLDSARPPPKFFFHFVPEKLHLSQTLCSLHKEFIVI